MRHKYGKKNSKSTKTSTLLNIDTIIDEGPELTTDVDEETKNYKLATKFQPGHKLHSIINLFSSSNLITLFIAPQIFSVGGLCLSLAIIFFFFAASYYSHLVLLKLILSKKSLSYPELIFNYKGKRLYPLYLVSYFLYTLGLLIIYAYFTFVFFSESYISSFILNHIPELNTDEGATYNIVYLSIIVGSMFFVHLMFSFMKNTNNISHINITILIIFVVIGLIMIIETFVEHFELSINNFIYKEIQFADSLIFAVFALGMCNHISIFQEIKVLKILSKERGKYIVTTTLLSQFVTLFMFGLIGALAKKSRYMVWIFEDQSSILMRIINCIIGLAFTVQTAFHAIKLNDSLATMNMFRIDSLTKIRYFFIIFVLLFIDGLLFVLLYYIESKTLYVIIVIIGFIGGVCLAIIGFVIPLVLYNKYVSFIEIAEVDHTYWNKIIICVMGLLGLIVTILSFFIHEKQFLPVKVGN